MNAEKSAILIENIIGAVRSCVEPLLVSVTDEVEHTVHAKPAPQISRPEPYTNDDSVSYASRYVDTPSEKCKRVEVSKRALTSLLAEAYANGINETGGPFFGQVEDGIWYLIETSGPGYGAYHAPARHEMNNQYVNYQYRALSRLYSKELTLTGFWHRHPGSYNQFSNLDDVVNKAYAEVIGNGTVSILLNFVPEPQLTCYYFDSEDGFYHLTPLVVDNKTMRQRGFLRYSSLAELAERAEDMQEAMEGIA